MRSAAIVTEGGQWGSGNETNCHHLRRDQSLVVFDMEKLRKDTAESFMYHGAGHKNRKELELKVKLKLRSLQKQL